MTPCLSVLLIIFGIVGITKGGFKVTKNLHVSGSVGRTLGTILLLGGALSLFNGLLGLVALGLVIAIGAIKAEPIGAGVDTALLGQSPARRIVFGVTLGLGITVLLSVGPIVILALFGPTIGDAVRKMQGVVSTPIPTRMPISLIDTAAADMNLQLSDLGASFSLRGEDKQDVFVNTSRKDGNQRLFASEGFAIQSTLFVFRSYPTGITSDVGQTLETTLRQEFKDETLVFDPASDVSVGEMGSLRKFSNKSAGAEGYVLFFVKQNVFARLTLYGLPDKVSSDEALRLAHIIEGRIR